MTKSHQSFNKYDKGLLSQLSNQTLKIQLDDNNLQNSYTAT